MASKNHTCHYPALNCMAMMAINSEVEPSSNGLRLDLVQEMSAREGGTDYLHLENVEIGVSTYLEDFKTYLLPFIRPEWSGIELDNKVFDTGVTNILVAIFNKEKGLRESREDVVLVRVNGAKTENIVDRDDEVVFYQTLNRAGFCPPLYARLKNGLCYGFFPGRQLSLAEAREWKMCRKITRLLACLHCMEIPEHFQGRKPQLWAKVRGSNTLYFRQNKVSLIQGVLYRGVLISGGCNREVPPVLSF